MEQTKSSHHYPILSDSSDSSNCTSSKFTKDAQIQSQLHPFECTKLSSLYDHYNLMTVTFCHNSLLDHGWQYFTKVFVLQFNKHALCFFLLLTQENGVKISAQPHTTVKQSRSPKGNLQSSPLFSSSKNFMHNEGWGWAQSYHNDLPFDNMSYLCHYMEVRTSTPLTL